MYLCIYFYNILHTVCDVQVSGKKKLWMSLEFLFVPLFETVLFIFCCFKDVSTPQGVICKLSFSSLLQYLLLREYTVLLSHLENTVFT